MSVHAPSYYAATATPFSIQPALQGEISADVVVVGAGFTGLSAALHAADAGYKVVVLEAQRIGFGASGRSGGQMIPGLRWGPAELIRELGRTRAAELIALANSAGDLVKARIKRHKIACDLRQGHFQAAAKPAHLDMMRRELDSLQDLVGYSGASVVGKAELGQYVGSRLYHGGLFDENGGHLHPLNYTLGLALAALAAGVRIFEHSPVVQMDHGSPVRATTEQGQVIARHAVLAADTWMGDVEPGLARMTMPVINYNVATAPLGMDLAQRLMPTGAAVSDSKFVLNYYRLSADHRLIFGGGEKYSPRPPHDVAAFVRPYLEEVFPLLKGVGIDYAWGGSVGLTLNRLPQFGRIGNSFYAHGWSGHGVLLTTLAGQLITEAMRGTAEKFDLFANLPKSPFPGGKLLRHPLYVAGMLYYALKDRL